MKISVVDIKHPLGYFLKPQFTTCRWKDFNKPQSADIFGYKPWREFFLIRNHHRYLSYLFPLHLNTYIPLCYASTVIIIFQFFNTEIDFRRQNRTYKCHNRTYKCQNRTSIDVRIWRLKTYPALIGLNVSHVGIPFDCRTAVWAC